MNYEHRVNILKYIFISFIISTYVYTIFYENKGLAIFVASCFFIILYFKIKVKLTLIILMFFIIPVINNINYYNLNIKKVELVRIISINNYGGVGKVQKRKVYLSGKLEGLAAGDKIKVIGEFTKDENREKGILGNYTVENYKVLDKDFTKSIYEIRKNIFNNLKNKLGYRRSAIITSIAFGYTDFLDNDDEENMKNLGILHAISVSGLHMVLVYSLLKKIFGEKFSPLISFIYVIFTGGALSTIRAYIMMVASSFSIIFRKNYNPLAGLSLAGIILILYEPFSIFSLGFQLSFVATLGIILFNKDINRKLYKLSKYLRESISICISAQILTFPILAISFKEFSLGFFLGNIILIPLINGVVVIGNLLALVFKIDFIFNYLAYLGYYVTLSIDLITERLIRITPSILYINKITYIGYILILIGSYFYIKGHRRFIYFPLSIIIFIIPIIYSPYPKVEYFKEGFVVVSNKFDKKVIKLKENLEDEKIKSIAFTENIIEDFKGIIINNKYKLNKKGNDLLLKIKEKEYIIKISKDKISTDYDIINLRDTGYRKIVLYNNKAIGFY